MQDERELFHLAGVEERVVRDAEVPQTKALLTHETLQRPGAVRRDGARIARLVAEIALAAVVIDHGLQPIPGAVIVQHHGRRGAIGLIDVAEDADEVASDLVVDAVGGIHALDDDGRIIDEHEDVGPARLVWRAVGNGLGHDEGRGDDVAVRIAGAEGQLAGGGEETEVCRLLILGLHPDVKYLVRLRVVVDEELGAATSHRFAGPRDGRVIQEEKFARVGDVGLAAARHVEIDVRLAVAGQREVGRKEGEDDDVGEGGAVLIGVEAPLVARAVGAGDERGIRPHALAEEGCAAVGGRAARLKDAKAGRRIIGEDRGGHGEIHVVGRADVAAGDDERVILDHAGWMAVERIHIHAVGLDRDGVAAGQGRTDVDVLHVVDQVAPALDGCQNIAVAGEVGVAGRDGDGCAEIAVGRKIISQPEER